MRSNYFGHVGACLDKTTRRLSERKRRITSFPIFRTVPEFPSHVTPSASQGESRVIVYACVRVVYAQQVATGWLSCVVRKGRGNGTK